MGYYKNNRKHKIPPFVMLEKTMLRSDEWKTLTSSAKLTYIGIKANYNGANNGQIAFKYSGSDFTDSTTSKALQELISKGWVEKTEHGGMFRYYCLYKLTGKYDNIR